VISSRRAATEPRLRRAALVFATKLLFEDMKARDPEYAGWEY
jgi:hypothetical protein